MKPELEIQGLSRETPFRDAAAMIVSHRVDNMLAHETGVREGVDIEALHDMRVYSRRSREALRIFQSCCEETRYKKVYRKVRTITCALGEVRNLDVFIAYFEGIAAGSADEQAVAAIADLVAWANKRRDELRKDMLAELDGLKPGKLTRNINKMLQPEAYRRGGVKVKDTIAFRSRGLMRERLRQVELAWKETSNAGGKRTEELHALRIAFKKLRYALEVLYIAFEREKLDAVYEQVKKFQDVLGDIHDADVFNEIVSGKLKKAEKKGDCLLSSGYHAVSSKLVAGRHKLNCEFTEMEKVYPFAKLAEEIELAYIPIQASPNKRIIAAPAATGAAAPDNTGSQGGSENG